MPGNGVIDIAKIANKKIKLQKVIINVELLSFGDKFPIKSEIIIPANLWQEYVKFQGKVEAILDIKPYRVLFK